MRFITLFLIIILIPSASAWNWDTHQAFADSVYYRLDDSIRLKLNLGLMEYGSITPDKEFKDFTRHSFPLSIKQAESWIEKMKKNVGDGDYNNASLSFGIASHYIVDSFSAPHSISGEEYDLHKKYEDQGSEGYKYADCISEHFSLGDVIYTGSQQGKRWEAWVGTRNNEFPQSAVHDAALYLTAIAMEIFNSSCNSFETKFEKEEKAFELWKMISIIVICLLILYFAASLYKDLKYGRK